jgi:hypothetical protein
MAFSASKLQQHLHLTSRIFLHAPNVVPGPMSFPRPAARDHGLGSCPYYGSEPVRDSSRRLRPSW